MLSAWHWSLQQHEIEAYINEPFKKSDDLLTGYKLPRRRMSSTRFTCSTARMRRSRRNRNGTVKAVPQPGSARRATQRRRQRQRARNVERRGRMSRARTMVKLMKTPAPARRARVPLPAKKAKRDKEEHDEGDVADDPEDIKVRQWRHKLQKTFLSNKGDPKEEDMPEMDKPFRTVEAYQSITIHYFTGRLGHSVCCYGR
ncbi:hypothetical protein EV421DRAFT_957132 [Armillaria borealis]|uniref:Uncharacterized protein n=1 Tax=Armillaria borealis TaxID=47425 RepID=A0AA39JAD4_9AGAR|nr:hypothetical protein EV421DRAFT_957132 [Armillaria borealis]